jgi:hypothetical protein
MKNAALYKLMDLIEDVKKLDQLISLHREHDPSDFMISQYEAKMTKLVGSLIDELASPPVQSPDSYLLIRKILNKYYHFSPEEALIADSHINKFAAII